MAGIPMTKEELLLLMPSVDQLDVLKTCKIHGRIVCPKPVAMHPDLEYVADAEGALHNWHTSPKGAPPNDWPMALTRAVRQYRAHQNMIDEDKREKDDARRKAEDEANKAMRGSV